MPNFPLLLPLPLIIVFFSFCRSLWLMCHVVRSRNCRRNNHPLHQKLKNITERCKKKLKRKAATSHAGPIACVGSSHKPAAVERRLAVLSPHLCFLLRPGLMMQAAHQELSLLLTDAMLPCYPGLLFLPAAHWLGHFTMQWAVFVVIFNNHSLLVLHVWQPGVVRFGG